MADDQDIDELFNRMYDDAIAQKGGSAEAVGAIPDPSVFLCPIFRKNKDAICKWLKKKLGDKAGSVVCWALSSVCAG